MLAFLNRILFRLYLTVRIQLLWTIYRIGKRESIKNVCQRIEVWNFNFIDFQTRFPFLNHRVFFNNYKYWIHWTTQMDIREKKVFNKHQPIVQLNEEDWIHFDFLNKTIPIFYLSFDFTINEWVRVELFDSIISFEGYIREENNSAESLINNVQNICRKKRMDRYKSKSGLTQQLE